MMRTLSPLALVVFLPGSPQRAPTPPAPLAEARALYLEDAVPPRPVAEVRARVVADGAGDTGWRLEIALSPIGAGVEPLPGFAGVPGTNLRTAEELDRLLADDALRLVTRHGGGSHHGALERVERRRLPARRVDAAGHLADGSTAAAWPAVVVFRSAPLPPGSAWSYLECDGVPRLAVQVVRAGAEVALAIESVGEVVAQPRGEVRR
jgi:hypothetical protein